MVYLSADDSPGELISMQKQELLTAKKQTLHIKARSHLSDSGFTL